MGRKDKFSRKCIACNQYKDKNELIKITKNYIDNEIIVEPNSLQFGRSAYICKNIQCVNEALKRNKISKFLKKNVEPDVKQKIKTVLEK